MSKAGRIVVVALLGIVWLGVSSTAASGAVEGDPEDQIVLSGRVEVPRGQTVGQVVVLRGVAVIEGVARGDVIVVSGRVTVTGQVSGSVVNLDGAVLLGPSAQVGEDVLARGRVTVRDGAQVEGRVRQNVPFSLRGPLQALGSFAAWLAVTVSTLVLGLLLLWLAPRAADSVVQVAQTAPVVAGAWGVAMLVGVPLAAVLLLMSLLALPLGLVLLLALGLLLSIGYAWSGWILGRLIVAPPRRRIMSLLAGVGILRVIGLIPFVSGISWGLGAAFGLGAATVALWRVRRVGGKHRTGRHVRVAGGGEAERVDRESEAAKEPVERGT